MIVRNSWYGTFLSFFGIEYSVCAKAKSPISSMRLVNSIDIISLLIDHGNVAPYFTAKTYRVICVNSHGAAVLLIHDLPVIIILNKW